MVDAWSREEVEATVTRYFEMLESELRETPYNKTEHRRLLSRALRSRSDGAIERKHQNISAILIELGFPYITGYKPLKNYQQLLYDVVADRLLRDNGLVTLVSAEVSRPAVVPSVDDILAALVEPPRPEPREQPWPRQVCEFPVGRRVTDYLAMEARNRSLGSAGEEFVVRFETARLLAHGLDRLAAQVERVSESRGDTEGYDVLSFEEGGRERLIEVKTTAYGRETPFFVTRNELAVSQEHDVQYHLYRVFEFRRHPRLFAKAGRLDDSFALDPVEYLARVG